MTNIEFTLQDQAIFPDLTPILASGGKNDIKVTFNFTYSEEWNGYTKTGVFYMDKNDIRFAKLDSQNSCFVPWETYRKDGILHIGVFGVKGDSKKTSALYEYTIREGAISDNGKPSDPTPEIYEQILSEFAKMETDFNNRINSVETRVDNLISAQPVDAELKDVRVGFDNTTYKSAGEAVRTQAKDLNLKINAFDDENPRVSIDAKSVQKNKALNNKGQVVDLKQCICSELMEFNYPKGYCIRAYVTMTDTIAGICFYDRNKSLIIAYDKKTAESKGITVRTSAFWAYYFEVPVNTKYLRLCRGSSEPLIKDNLWFEIRMPNFALGHSLHIKGNNIDEYFDGSQNKELDLAKIQGSSKYEDLPDKPSVNGVPLVGNKTSKDLKINVETDKTLSVEGQAAEAKAVGDKFKNLPPNNSFTIDITTSKIVGEADVCITTPREICEALSKKKTIALRVIDKNINENGNEIFNTMMFTQMYSSSNIYSLPKDLEHIFDTLPNGFSFSFKYNITYNQTVESYSYSISIFPGYAPDDDYNTSPSIDYADILVESKKDAELQRDTTLSKAGWAADAKAVGDRLSAIEAQLKSLKQ